MTTKFLNCPFCDSDQIYETKITHSGCYTVICGSCFAKGPAAREGDEAIKLWNERKGFEIIIPPRN